MAQIVVFGRVMHELVPKEGQSKQQYVCFDLMERSGNTPPDYYQVWARGDDVTSGLDPVIRDDILDILLDFVQDEEHSILISSHITTDLEKIADYIVFIHEGKVVFSKPKDELTEQYGIIKCGAAQFDVLDKSDIIVYRKMDYEWQVLIADRMAMQKKYPKAMIVPATIDEIMLLYVKGEK